jgi:hypothetical protein
MRSLLDNIERAMRDENPFCYRSFEHDANYYYEAKNMLKLLRTQPMTEENMLDMCMDAFQLYYNNNPIWDRLAAKLFSVVNERLHTS